MTFKSSSRSNALQEKSSKSGPQSTSPPIEDRPWICFSSRSNIRMTKYFCNRKNIAQKFEQTAQRCILTLRERERIATFEFNPEREIVASLTPAP